jgi:hypothetical protein
MNRIPLENDIMLHLTALVEKPIDGVELIKLFGEFLERVELYKTKNKDVKAEREYDSEMIFSHEYDAYIKCPICGCIHKYGDSFCSYYVTRGSFGVPICGDCYEIEHKLRFSIEELIGRKNKGLVNELISELVKEKKE